MKATRNKSGQFSKSVNKKQRAPALPALQRKVRSNNRQTIEMLLYITAYAHRISERLNRLEREIRKNPAQKKPH